MKFDTGLDELVPEHSASLPTIVRDTCMVELSIFSDKHTIEDVRSVNRVVTPTL